MNELERSIAAYAQYLDEQSLARSRQSLTRPPDLVSEGESHEGELIVVDIQTRDSNKTSIGEPSRKRWRPYAIVTAAAAVVLLMVLAFALFGSTDDNFQLDVVDDREVDAPVVTSLETLDPVVAENLAVATSFMDAFVDGDIDEALTYAVEFQIWRNLSGSLSMLRNEREWMTAVGWTVEVDECAVTVADPTNTWVTCTILNETAWGGALGRGPYPGEYRFRINRGEHMSDMFEELPEPAVTAMEEEFPWTDFYDEVMSPFTDWLEATHPDDVERMFRPADGENAGVPVLPWVIPEVRDLWQQHTEEFVAEQASS